MLVSGGSIYYGTKAISQVYQGEDLIWPLGPVAPAWPKNYFYQLIRLGMMKME